MLRKNLAISTLMFATFIMLAQVIIPHHHHDESNICIEESHCEILDECHAEAALHDTHEQESNDETCTFDQLIIVKPEKKSENKNEEFFVQKTSNAYVDLTFLPQISGEKYLFNQDNFLQAYYLTFFNQSKGLRAPPSC